MELVYATAIAALIAGVNSIILLVMTRREQARVRAEARAESIRLHDEQKMEMSLLGNRIGNVDARVAEIGINVDGRLAKLLEVTGEKENLRGQATGRAEGRQMQLDEAAAAKLVVSADAREAKKVIDDDVRQKKE